MNVPLVYKLLRFLEAEIHESQIRRKFLCSFNEIAYLKMIDFKKVRLEKPAKTKNF